MALRKAACQLLRATESQRSLHTSNVNNGRLGAWIGNLFASKPLPTHESSAVGYERIVMEAAKVGEDPFECVDREERTLLAGSGTKADPYVINSRNTRRAVLYLAEGKVGPPHCFWVTLENGGRNQWTGEHYVLNYDPSDKWGIDELDLFKH
jgi:hypothetical protein